MTSALRGAPVVGVALIVLTASACSPATTLDPASTASTTQAAPTARVAPTAAPSTGKASPAPSTRSADSPYHLDIPAEDQHEVSRWASGERGGTVIFDDLEAGRDYRIDGACIFGYGDELRYRVLDTRPTKVRDRTIAEGSVRCDGHVHARTLRVRVSGPVQLLPGETGDKTVAYLRVLPGAR